MPDNNNYDNEDTMLLPEDLDSCPTQNSGSDLPPLKMKHHAADRQRQDVQKSRQQINYYNDNLRRSPQNRGNSDRTINYERPSDRQFSRPQGTNGYNQYQNEGYNRQFSRPQGNNQYQSEGYNRQFSRPPQGYRPEPPRRQQPEISRNDDYYYDDPRYDDRPVHKSRPESQHYSNPPKQKKKKHHKSFIGKLIRRIFWFVFIIFMLIFGVYSCSSLCLISKVDKVSSTGHAHPNDALEASYVKSILILGSDSRSSDDSGRSDSMILLSLNSATNEMTTTSFMRDCYVEIPNYGWNKLNAAFAYGGAELLMETIEHNFGVRIDNYVSVDFLSFASIIDSVGGIDVDISDAEAEEINNILISEVNELVGDDRMADLLSGGGRLHLIGKQALSYARIRNVGNSDFERTERQRRVIELMTQKLKSFNPQILPNIATNVIPDVSTNMSTAELYLYSLRLPFALGYDHKQIQIPVDGTFYADSNECGDVLQVDFDSNYNFLCDSVFSRTASN